MFYLDAWTFSYEHYKMMAFTVNMHALEKDKTIEHKKTCLGREHHSAAAQDWNTPKCARRARFETGEQQKEENE